MFDQYVDFIEKTMDVSALRRKVNGDNIANYNTPGFKASKVKFEEMFEKQKENSMITTNEKHMVIGSLQNDVQMVKDTTTKERYDGNNVDLNAEMVEMIKNNYRFNMSVQAINKEFSLNKTAIGRP